MYDISLPLANLLYNISNVALILGAVLAVLGTVGTIWMGSIREVHTDRRVSENETKTAGAMEASAKANQRTEELKNSNTELQIELEKERAERLKLEKTLQPRRISYQDKESLLVALARVESRRITVGCSMNDSEALGLAMDFVEIFNRAGWKKEDEICEQYMWSVPQYGVNLTVNPEDYASRRMHNSLRPITSFFIQQGLSSRHELTLDAKQEVGTCRLAVGHKVA